MAGQVGSPAGKLQHRIRTASVPTKWVGQAAPSVWSAWHSHSLVIHWPLGFAGLPARPGCVCGREAESRTATEGARQRANVFVPVCVCVSLRACLIRAGSQACFSGLQQLNYKTCCNPSCSLYITAPIRGLQQTGILQVRPDPVQWLH